MNEITWKAYEEVNFKDQYILRWVREGDEYVNKMTKEMMEDLKSVVRQLQAENEALKTENSHLKYEISSGAWNLEELTDQEIFNIYAYQQDTYTGDNFPVAVGRAIIKEAKKK